MKRFRSTRSALLVVLMLAASVFVAAPTATAVVPSPVVLGSAASFVIRADASVTNVPTSAITGNTGLSPAAGTFYTDATFCTQVTGTIFATSAAPLLVPCAMIDPGTTVQSDAATAWVTASGLAGATAVSPIDLSAANVGSGVGVYPAGLYSFGSGSTNMSGTVTLDAQGNRNAVWVFQESSNFVTSPGATVAFSNLPAGVTAAQMACNVFWTAGNPGTAGSAAFNTGNTFIGTMLAEASITVASGANITGRLLASNAAATAGSVTLIADKITLPSCPVPAAPVPAAPVAPVPANARFTG